MTSDTINQILIYLMTAGLLGILGIVAKLYVDKRTLEIKNRELELQESKQTGEHHLKIKVDDREGLAALVGLLQTQVTTLHERHNSCERELEEERNLRRALERRVRRMERQFRNYQISVVERLPDSERTPMVEAMLVQLKREARAIEEAEDESDDDEPPPDVGADGGSAPQ